MREKVIIALDFKDKNETMTFLSHFKDEQLAVKVGMELFYKEGPSIIKELKQLGHEIFLDLKLHDIPTTVKKTMMNLVELEVDMITVHASGGIEMMKAAKEGLIEASKNLNKRRPICIAVTQLTSNTEEMIIKELLIKERLLKTVVHYAENTRSAGLDGVVCSPLEAKLIHDHLTNHFLCVTPGIRLEHEQNDDQKRVATPTIAKEYTSDYIVVGRSITKASNPYSIYLLIKQLFNKGELLSNEKLQKIC